MNTGSHVGNSYKIEILDLRNCRYDDYINNDLNYDLDDVAEMDESRVIDKHSIANDYNHFDDYDCGFSNIFSRLMVTSSCGL